MISSLDPSGERFLLDVGRIQTAITRASQQVSSGLRVATPSDAPDQISGILQVHAGLERNAQILANLSRVQSETSTAGVLATTAAMAFRSMAVAVEVSEWVT